MKTSRIKVSIRHNLPGSLSRNALAAAKAAPASTREAIQLKWNNELVIDWGAKPWKQKDLKCTTCFLIMRIFMASSHKDTVKHRTFFIYDFQEMKNKIREYVTNAGGRNWVLISWRFCERWRILTVGEDTEYKLIILARLSDLMRRHLYEGPITLWLTIDGLSQKNRLTVIKWGCGDWLNH